MVCSSSQKIEKPDRVARATPRNGSRHCGVVRDDGGFTLVEMLVVIVIMPLIVGAISLGLISVFSLQNGVSGRLTDSAGAQIVSSAFLKDVQSAALLTTQSSPPQCQSALASPPAQTQLLGLAWNGSGSSINNYQTYVSYVTELDGTTNSLVRQSCSAGNTTASSTSIIATNVDATQTKAPTITCAPSSICSTSDPSKVWIPAKGVTLVSLQAFGVVHSGSGTSSTPFTYTLSATPRILNEASGGSGRFPFSPMTLLGSGGSTCGNESPAGPPFNMVGNSANTILSISVSGQPGSVSIGSTCRNSMVFGQNATAVVASVLTEDPSLNAISKNGAAPPQYYTSQVLDPFSTSTPPLMAPAKPGTIGNCSAVVSGVSTCTPGYYSFDPGTVSANKLDFKTGVYYFGAGVNLGMDASNSDNGGVLFYVPNGAVSFGSGTYTLNGLSSYQGIAIWDDSASTSANVWSNPLTFTNPAGTYQGGGFYVPNGGILDSANSNTGSITTTFIVAGWANFNNNAKIYIAS